MPELFMPGHQIDELGGRVESGLVLCLRTPGELGQLLHVAIDVLQTPLKADELRRSAEDAMDNVARRRLRMLAGHILALPNWEPIPTADPDEEETVGRLVEHHLRPRLAGREPDEGPDAFEALVLSLAGQIEPWRAAQRSTEWLKRDSDAVCGSFALLLADPLQGARGTGEISLDAPRALLTTEPGSIVSGLGFYGRLKTRSWLTGLSARVLSVGWRSATPAARQLVERTRERAEARTTLQLPRLDRLGDKISEHVKNASVVVVCVHGLFSTDLATFDGVLTTMAKQGPEGVLQTLDDTVARESSNENPNSRQLNSRQLTALTEDARALRNSFDQCDPKVREQLSKAKLFEDSGRRNDLDSLADLGVVVLGFPHNTLAPIKTNAQELELLLRDQMQDMEAKVVFLCHSRGGLVARHALAELGKDHNWQPRLADLVTFGTPHEGAALAEATAARDAAAYLLGMTSTQEWVSLLDVCAYLQEYGAAGIEDLRPKGHRSSYNEELVALELALEQSSDWRYPTLLIGGAEPPVEDWLRRKASSFLCWRIGTRLHDLVVELDSSLWTKRARRHPARLRVPSDHFGYFKCAGHTKMALNWASARIFRHVDWSCLSPDPGRKLDVKLTPNGISVGDGHLGFYKPKP